MTAAATLGAETAADDDAASTTEAPAETGASSGAQETGAPGSTGNADSSGGSPDTGAPATSDTGGPVGDPYGMCEQTPDCMSGIEEACIMVASMCSAPCTDDPECPAPPSGDATPACVQTSGVTRCLLTCDETTTCPTGMMCAAPAFDSCIWP